MKKLLCSLLVLFGISLYGMESDKSEASYVVNQQQLDLYAYAQSGDLKKVRQLVNNSNVSLALEHPETHLTALDYAASAGKNKIVIFLLKKALEKRVPLDLDVALRCALESGDYPQVVGALCSYKVDLWSDHVPLLVAAEEGRLNSIHSMTTYIKRHRKCKEILAEKNEHGENAMLLAAAGGHWDVVQALNVLRVLKVPDKNGRTVDSYHKEYLEKKDMEKFLSSVEWSDEEL